jgi:predicted NBD/HSP70 family sugar kinase
MLGPNAERAFARRLRQRRMVLLVIIGLGLGGAIVVGASLIMDASEYYAQSLAAAMPMPSGHR